MFDRTTRRDFLRNASAGGALAGLGALSWHDVAFLGELPRVSAAEARLASQVVQLDPEIEPTVRLLEETPRDRLLEEVAARLRQGLTYREVLAGLLLAGVRNVQPRPSVGFKFHAVLVVNSAHLASLASPDEHRWLPIFWALDYFKDSQARDEHEGNWTMAPVDESAVPSADGVRQEFSRAMDRWDEPAADVAAAGLVRSLEPKEVFEIFCRFGARDFRSIGHKAIYVANAWRTLEQIGWRHAEPVVRSLAYALLNHDGTNPATADLPPDRPWRENQERARRIRADWQQGQLDSQATAELLGTLGGGSAGDVCGQVVEMLNRGVAPQSIWDALLLGAGELLGRQPGIVALHAVTSTNALRFAFATSDHDETRRLLLLQNAAFLPLFREAMHGRGQVGDFSLPLLEAAPLKAEGEAALDEIFSLVSTDRLAAARKVLAYAGRQPDPREFIDAARLLLFFKGNNAHDYKFSSAVLEDYAHVSPEWRPRYLAASVFNLRGSGSPDNRLVERTRAALGA